MTTAEWTALEGIPNEPGKEASANAGSPTGLLGNVEGWVAGFPEPCGS